MENNIVNLNDYRNLQVFLLTLEINCDDTMETINELIKKVAAGELELSYKELLATITAIKDQYEEKENHILNQTKNILYPNFNKPFTP